MNIISAKVNLSVLNAFAIVMTERLKLALIIAAAALAFVILVIIIACACAAKKRKKNKKIQAEQTKSLISLLSDTPIEFDKQEDCVEKPQSVIPQESCDSGEIDSILEMLKSDKIEQDTAVDDKIIAGAPVIPEGDGAAKNETDNDLSDIEAQGQAMTDELMARLAVLDDSAEPNEQVLAADSEGENQSSEEDFFAELEKLKDELSAEDTAQNASVTIETVEDVNADTIEQGQVEIECLECADVSQVIDQAEDIVEEETEEIISDDSVTETEEEQEAPNDEQPEPIVSLADKIAKKKNEIIDLRSQLPTVVDEATGRKLYSKFFEMQKNLDSDEKSSGELVDLIILSRKDVAFAVQMARYKKILAENRSAAQSNSARASNSPRRKI